MPLKLFMPQSMSTIAGAILALVLHPHVQVSGQAELDVVIGRDRLPNFSDRDQLPYVSAICREVLRWKNVTPLGVSHACLKDDVYEGMFIPRGASVGHVGRSSGMTQRLTYRADLQMVVLRFIRIGCDREHLVSTLSFAIARY